jgi:hypothetical protein
MEWQKIKDEYDPDRCQGVDSDGQCHHKRAAPSNYCPRHGGNRGIAAAEKEKIRNYQLGKWRNRVNAFADNPEVKSLREEIGILRMMLETTLNKCQDDSDLIIYAGKIQELVRDIERVVNSCHKLEERTGVLLDKPTILTLADTFVRIIGEHVMDPDALEIIGTKLIDVVAKMGGLQNVADARLNG